ncbi:hypothetical protein [Planococcus shenhongbingii]|uniref:Uncharacterized protein n=1 Tax=Planococcus shenhongbingii TaxID=3058398 RepID=A0ABT8NER0_9BACL|nr:hypothetical protein [Planococcus sp. N017]MDN7246248.1 hypothetical protein [Planococcus sp. N017]
MKKFAKWLTTAFVLGLIALLGAFFTEDIARMTGEFNRTILLISVVVVFVLILSSLLSIIKANGSKIKREMVASFFVALIPLAALVVNGLIFTVYFVGK